MKHFPPPLLITLKHTVTLRGLLPLKVENTHFSRSSILVQIQYERNRLVTAKTTTDKATTKLKQKPLDKAISKKVVQ